MPPLTMILYLMSYPWRMGHREDDVFECVPRAIVFAAVLAPMVIAFICSLV